MPKELLYSCFLACTDYTDDNFWKNIFEELAFGVCPSSTYINKNYIISNSRGKEFVYKINPDLEPETLFWDVYNLLSEKVGIKSTREIEEYKQNIDNSETIYVTWSNIKKKTIRDAIILQYVLEQTDLYELSRSKSRELFNLINLGILLKFIVSKHIILNNGRIESIYGFLYSKNDFIYTKNVDYASNTIEYNKFKIPMNELWIRFVEILGKTVYTK